LKFFLTLVCSTVLLAAQADEPRAQLYRYIDGIARVKLEERQQSVAQIRTKAEAERRKAANREKILRLIGGLPERSGPVAVKGFGTLAGDGFRVEKIAYESLPGFWVTADLYIPGAGGGPFPAIVVAPGHGAAGKTALLPALERRGVRLHLRPVPLFASTWPSIHFSIKSASCRLFLSCISM
jgi:hypothetical protein